MDLGVSCPQNYSFNSETGLCEHFFFPLSSANIAGFVMTFVVAGFASLAGVGGGTPHLVALMMLYNYTPKQSTIVIFSCILGTTLGNVLSQMRQKINNEPIIQYKYSFVAIPIIFIGSIIGVLLNKLFPSAAVCAFIMYWAAVSIKGIYQKFITSYRKETQQNACPHTDKSQKYLQTQFNPLEEPTYRYIFKNLACLFLLFFGLAMVKGTEKLDSVVGIQRCSGMYWVLYFTTFLCIAYFAKHNLNTLKEWELKPALLNDQIASNQNNIVEENINIVVEKSFLAGIFSGMGLGGGIFLIPMYKALGCNPIQAAATCSFTVFSGSLLNVIQGILLGIIGFQDFIILFSISIFGSFICSTYISRYLQKINRVSIVQGILLFLVVIALINLPLSLYTKYVRNGRNAHIIFGFGSLC